MIKNFLDIFELMVNLYQSFFVIDILTRCLKSRFTGKRKNYLFTLAVLISFLQLTYMNILLKFEGIIIVVPILLHFFYAYFCLKSNLLHKLFLSIYVMILIMGVTSLSLSLGAFLFNVSYFTLIEDRNIRRITILVFIQFVLFLIRILIIKFNKNERSNIKTIQWIGLLAIPLISIFTMTYVLDLSITISELLTIESQFYENNTEKMALILKDTILTILGITITNMIVYYLYFRLQKENDLKLKYNMLIQKYETHKQNVNEIMTLYQKMKTIQHDFKNHLFIILSRLSKNKTYEAINYVEELGRIYSLDFENTIFCSNDIINYVINSKIQDCKGKNIKIVCEVCTEETSISDVDLSVLLCNMLDNAVEGCSSFQEKLVIISIKLKDNFLCIQTKNTIKDSVLKKNPGLLTTKKDYENHGMGIQSVRNIVDSYNGIIDFYEEGRFFCCDILLDVAR